MEVQFVHGVIVGHARGHEDILALSCKCPTQMHRTEALICTTRSEFSITLRSPRVCHLRYSDLDQLVRFPNELVFC